MGTNEYWSIQFFGSINDMGNIKKKIKNLDDYLCYQKMLSVTYGWFGILLVYHFALNQD